MQRRAVAAEHWPEENRLRGWDRGVGITHGGPSDHPAFDDDFGLHPEERGLPEDQVGELARFDGADFVTDPRARWQGRW